MLITYLILYIFSQKIPDTIFKSPDNNKINSSPIIEYIYDNTIFKTFPYNKSHEK